MSLSIKDITIMWQWQVQDIMRLRIPKRFCTSDPQEQSQDKLHHDRLKLVWSVGIYPLCFYICMTNLLTFSFWDKKTDKMMTWTVLFASLGLCIVNRLVPNWRSVKLGFELFFAVMNKPLNSHVASDMRCRGSHLTWLWGQIIKWQIFQVIIVTCNCKSHDSGTGGIYLRL